VEGVEEEGCELRRLRTDVAEVGLGKMGEEWGRMKLGEARR
jgi:hypothetical protein